MARARRLVVALALVASPVVTVATQVAAPPAGAAPVVNPTIDRTSKASVRSAYLTSLAEARAVPTGWTGSTATCTKGTESAASIEATRAAVNFYRAMNGLPGITMDATLNGKALAGALIQQAGGSFTNHFPPSGAPCYTAEGALASAASNLSAEGPAAWAIDAYLEERGAGNESAGHRRWVLDPQATTFGTGSTTGYNALWVFGAGGSEQTGPRPSGVEWISWPSAGFVPKALIRPRFSLSSNTNPDANYAAAAVTVKVGATTLPVTVQAPTGGAGDNTLVWDVTLPAGFATSGADVTFDVTVSGMKTSGGASIPNRSWSTTAFVGQAAGAPSAVTGTPGDGYVFLNWKAPADDGGSPVTGYRITPYLGANAQTPADFTGSTSTIQAITGLTNSSAYTFKVQAYTEVGLGATSAASAPITPIGAATVPGAPTGASATAGNGQATVTWTAPSGNGGSAITGYKITPSIGGSAQSVVTSSGTGTSKVVTGLTNGTAYTFKVAAVNAIGTGSPSSATAAVTPSAPATVPGAPTGASATAGNGQATVTWTAPAGNGGSAITGYKITPSIGGSAQSVVTSSGTGTSKVVTGLTNGTAYTFKVAAVNAIGTGSPSSATAAVTPTAPSGPGYLPFASWSAFVTRQYTDLTSRAPTSAELSSWVTALTNGSKAKGDLDHELRRGTENLANVDPVVRVYRAFLRRAPDAGGLQFWIKRKRNVAPATLWSVTKIATEFTGSAEFKAAYGSLTNRQFATEIYTDVLGRAADTAGVDYWSRQLDTGKKTKAQVMVGFSESSEYKTKQAENTDAAVAYLHLLGRAPSAGELLGWTTRQKAGTSHQVLLTELLDSTAYATRATG